MPVQQQLLLIDAPVAFGMKAVARKDLVDWALRTHRVLPPTVPSIFDFRLIHLDSFIAAVERGSGSGDGGHALRAALALLDSDTECDAVLAERVHARDVMAARHYLRVRAPSQWATALRQAIDSQLPVHDLPLDDKRPSQPINTTASAVLDAIREAGYDPHALPPGRPGMMSKAKVGARDVALSKGMNVQAFDKEWDRLRRRGLLMFDQRLGRSEHA